MSASMYVCMYARRKENMLGMTFNIVVKDVYMCANYTSMNKKKCIGWWVVVCKGGSDSLAWLGMQGRGGACPDD